MTRGQAKTTDNSEYLAFVRQNYLNKLKQNLPKTVLDKTTWLSPPHVLTEVRLWNCMIRLQTNTELRYLSFSLKHVNIVSSRHQRY